MQTLIRNGVIVTAADTYKADILIEEGVIAAIGQGFQAETVIHAAGKYVFPGFIITSCSRRIVIRRWMHKMADSRFSRGYWTVVQQEQGNSYPNPKKRGCPRTVPFSFSGRFMRPT
jgi:N-acyl-D-aspartate/D-glutamate deacylase